MKKLAGIAALASFIAAGGTADATVITSISGGTTLPMPVVNSSSTGPVTFGSPEVTWTSQFSGSVFGYTSGYAYGANGFWDNGLTMAGTNDVGSTMSFDFSSPVTAVGGFINYAVGNGTPVISVYDSNDTLIESYTLNFSTGGGVDKGFFYGFSETTPIKYFELSGSFIGIANLTAMTSPVPEPSTWAMMLLGFAGLGFMAYRRKSKPSWMAA
jgi:hypothetical protein